jgi:hypothetical protein
MWASNAFASRVSFSRRLLQVHEGQTTVVYLNTAATLYLAEEGFVLTNNQEPGTGAG